jgi:hypothetical protein
MIRICEGTLALVRVQLCLSLFLSKRKCFYVLIILLCLSLYVVVSCLND